MTNFQVPQFTLNNGRKMPAVGLGTWDARTPGEIESALEESLANGYRHIDTAWVYDNEKEIGNALKRLESKYPRESLFITSKLWNIFHQPEKVRSAVLESLRDLQTGYLDLYLIHWPVPQVVEEGQDSIRHPSGKPAIDLTVTLEETYAAMEQLVDEGLVRSIGVSNFSKKHLDRILRVARIKPVVIQCEAHPYLPQHDLVQYCLEKNILVTAYSPLGRAKDLFQDPVVLDIAKQQNATPAQVVLSWGVQRGTSVIPKSTNPQRIKDNISLIQLTAENMKALDSLTITNGKEQRIVNAGATWGVKIWS